MRYCIVTSLIVVVLGELNMSEVVRSVKSLRTTGVGENYGGSESEIV